LNVAKQLVKNPISIPQVIHEDDLNFKDEKIGIVCPIFAGQPPKMVVDFIKKTTFHTDYLYIIMTYGMNHSDSPEYTFRFAKSVELM
jgi:hypothetical protein